MMAISCECVCIQQCSGCLGVVAPLSCWPRREDGSTDVVMCIALDICPMCRSAREQLTDDDLRRILAFAAGALRQA
jgi:hypothetical protein